MKSIHLKHLVERLDNDPDLSNNKLFFNADGTVNIDELYAVLEQYGVTKDMILSSMHDHRTVPLTNNYLDPISKIDMATIGDYDLKWINGIIKNNTLVESVERWNANNPPTDPEYFDTLTHTWVPMSGDIPRYKRIDKLIPDTDVYKITGLSCSYGKIDIAFLKLETVNMMDFYGSAILTLNKDGSINFYDVSDYTLPLGQPSVIMDLARFGSTVYYFGFVQTWMEMFNGLIDSHTVVNDLNFNDIDQDAAVTDCALTVIGYILMAMVITSNDNVRVFAYDLIRNSIQYVLPDDMPNQDRYLNVPNLALEFITEAVCVYFNQDTDAIECRNLGSDDTLNWSIPTPKVETKGASKRISGISYDPINGYLYMTTSNTLVRYLCSNG